MIAEHTQGLLDIDAEADVRSLRRAQDRLQDAHSEEERLRQRLKELERVKADTQRERRSALRRIDIRSGKNILITAEEMDELQELEERRTSQFDKTGPADRAALDERASAQPLTFLDTQAKELRDLVETYTRAAEQQYLLWDVNDDSVTGLPEGAPVGDSPHPPRAVYYNPSAWEGEAMDEEVVEFALQGANDEPNGFTYNEATGVARVNLDKWVQDERTERELAEEQDADKRRGRAGGGGGTGRKRRQAEPAKKPQPAPKKPRKRSGMREKTRQALAEAAYFPFVLEGLDSMGVVCVVCMEQTAGRCTCTCYKCGSASRVQCREGGCPHWGVSETTDLAISATRADPYNDQNSDWPREIVGVCGNVRRARLYMAAARAENYKPRPVFGNVKDRNGSCALCRRFVRRISTRKIPWCDFCDQFMHEKEKAEEKEEAE